MRRSILTPVLSTLAVVASMLVATPAHAHGYVSSPASRQALCAQGKVTGCGDIVWEPQSVEAPKGSMQCNGGGSRFAELNDNSKNWPATQVTDNVTFTWVLTARHRTSTWEYFVGGTRIAVFDDGGAQPGATMTHNVNLGGRTGRFTVLARWNVYDTINAFYSCVDVQVGTGPSPSPSPSASPSPSPSASPSASPSPSRSATPSPSTSPTTGGTWAAGTTYAVGATVTYGGLTYRCRQGHTAIAGWEPPNVPALWQLV
ncbi:lytic polysaccharide monooxygenase [Catellatospora sp. KI3]|uniref:lytic polysaccharide monooxygenase n=1 Tax=Catellatospora sp. KI3 TaxID=3041620 RepID=UPI0024830277|nr:lytic polysaccharide monooxygenase [Catellatospora sp. KI3]MDI1465197.1 lytic polysaccharide monooxygenase [Catellatospora sp. KI3]